MKNQGNYSSKHFLLTNGMLYLALNNDSLLFTFFAFYGLFLIKNYSLNNNLVDLSKIVNSQIMFNLIRLILLVVTMFYTSASLPYILFIINVIIFIFNFYILKFGLNIINTELKYFDLTNMQTKVNSSFKVIVTLDILNLLFLFLVILAIIYPNQILLNILSIGLNISYNFLYNIALLAIKYYMAKQFNTANKMIDQAYVILNN